jgi:hypothetical protein
LAPRARCSCDSSVCSSRCRRERLASRRSTSPAPRSRGDWASARSPPNHTDPAAREQTAAKRKRRHIQDLQKGERTTFLMSGTLRYWASPWHGALARGRLGPSSAAAC